MARSYQKRNLEYWENRRNIQPQQTIANNTPVNPTPVPVPFPDINYGTTEISYADAPGMPGLPSTSANTRGRQVYNFGGGEEAFQNIRSMRLPWDPASNGVYMSSKSAINLCARACTGIPVARNAVEIATEFSNQPLYVKCKNKTVQRFFSEWLNAIQINKLKSESFREYYRSGNVFFQRFDGKFGPKDYVGMKSIFGTKSDTLPIRYVLLNPENIFVQSGLTFPHVYVRLLSTFEIERLKKPITKQDKQVFDQLPAFIKKQIEMANNFPLGLYVPIDPDRLRFFFYKKQSYEPLATPMLWPILPLLEWKLVLQKMDKDLAKTVEQAILLLTTGESANEWNGGNGVNQNNIARLQALMMNQSISRVLVGDHTLKGQWLIPDLKGLGPDKYQVVNEDIREGLQSLLTGDDKFANAQTRAKIFIQRLEEGQKCFLEDFLLPEIISICDKMGFRDIPEIGFQKIDLQDESVFARVYAQLASLGLLTDEGLTTALNSGILPNPDESVEQQRRFKELRDEGLFQPLMSKQGPQSGGRPDGTTGIPQSTKNISPQGTSKGGISLSRVFDLINKSAELENKVVKKLKTKFSISSNLNDEQYAIAKTLTEIIVAQFQPDEWDKKISFAIKKPFMLSDDVSEQIEDIKRNYNVSSWDAALLRHCIIK